MSASADRYDQSCIWEWQRSEVKGGLKLRLKLVWYGHGHLIQTWYTVPSVPQHWSLVTVGELA